MSPRKAGKPKSSTNGSSTALTVSSSKASPSPVTKRPPGRPSLYTPQLVDRLCEEIAKGRSVHRICEEDWAPSEDTFYTWLHQHPEFSEKYVRARECQADHMAAEILEIADDTEHDTIIVTGKDGATYEKTDSARVQRAQLRVNARQWQMARMSPRRWGSDRVVDDNEGNVVPKAVIIVCDSGTGAGPPRQAVGREEHEGD
jgi:hypothetical protein